MVRVPTAASAVPTTTKFPYLNGLELIKAGITIPPALNSAWKVLLMP